MNTKQKIAVYDKDNKARLLGSLVFYDNMSGVDYKAAVTTRADIRNTYLQQTHVLRTSREIIFDIDLRSDRKSRSIDSITREITIVERKVLLTNATLEELLKLDRFYLPEEGQREHEERLNFQRQFH